MNMVCVRINVCVCVWMSGRGGEGVGVEDEGGMLEYIQIICKNGYTTHVHVTLMYVTAANLMSIKFISRVEINDILKPFLTIAIHSFQFSTSIWICSKILYFYMYNIWIIHLFNVF